MTRSVLFVCLGNICRSPAAEGVMRKQLEEAGLSDAVFVDSAGTAGYHSGERADTRMRQAAKRRGYELDSLARQLEPADLNKFDLIIAMDRENFSNVQRVSREPSPHIRMLSDYLGEDWPRDVPDPYRDVGGDSSGGWIRTSDLWSMSPAGTTELPYTASDTSC